MGFGAGGVPFPVNFIPSITILRPVGLSTKYPSGSRFNFEPSLIIDCHSDFPYCPIIGFPYAALLSIQFVIAMFLGLRGSLVDIPCVGVLRIDSGISIKSPVFVETRYIIGLRYIPNKSDDIPMPPPPCIIPAFVKYACPVGALYIPGISECPADTIFVSRWGVSAPEYM